MAETTIMTKNTSVGARAGGAERGGIGISKPTFSSRSLAEFSRPMFRTPEMSAAGRKVAIGNEKMSLIPTGAIPRPVGLGDYANAGNLSGRRNESPKTIKSTPTFVEFVPTLVDVATPEINKTTGENLLKTTRDFQIPIDAQSETQLSETVVKQENILRELHEVSAAHHQKIREVETVLQTKKRVNTKDGVLVEPIQGFEQLNESNSKKISEKPSVAFVYRTILARKEADKAAQDSDAIRIEKKHKAKRNVEEVTKVVRNKFEKQLRKLALVVTPTDKKVLTQTKTAIQTMINARAVRLNQTSELPDLIESQADKISSAVQSELSGASLPFFEAVAQVGPSQSLLPEHTALQEPNRHSLIPYSVDERAAAARLQQVVEAGRIVFNETNESEYVSGSEIVSVMQGPTQITTSDIVRDYQKDENSDVTGIDGSDSEWRYDLSTRLISAATLISEAVSVVRGKPVQKGPGETVTTEDAGSCQTYEFTGNK